MGATADMHEEGAAGFSGSSSKAHKTGSKSALRMLPPEEARVRAIAECVNALINDVHEGRDVDLNRLKGDVRQQTLVLPSRFISAFVASRSCTSFDVMPAC